MKVQKFNSTALVKILNQYKDVPNSKFHRHNSQTRADIISARDAWISGGEEHNGKFMNIKIIEKDDEVVIETGSYTFRVSGDFVTKEQSI